MGSLSNYAENKVLDHIFKVASYTPATHLYIALSTADPTEDGSGTAEPVGNNYARIICDTWDAASARATANTSVITFNTPSGNWGTITHYAIYDAVSGGNMIGYGTLNTPNAVVSGNVLTLAAGDVDIVYSAGAFFTYLANKVLDHVFKTAAYTVPTNIYVALSTSTPADAGTGVTEPSGNGYARTQCNTWDAASGGATQNTNAVTFPQASGSWGTITYAVMYDASTAGNPLAYSPVGPSSQAVVNTNYVTFDAGAIDVTQN